MKNLKRIDEAVGSILERRAAADRLLKDVINGNTSEVEGIKLSKQMAQGFLDWLKYSTYGKKFGALPFNMLFTAAFNWGLDRYVKGARTEVKDEFKELKAKAKEMSKQQKMKAESVQLSEKRSSPYGEIMLDIDAAAKQVKLPMIWLKDYVKSIERMAKRNAKKFFKDYGTFSVDDWAEDMEYNFANESKVNERLARGLKPLLKLGLTITKKAGEDALLDLSDKFDNIDDEQAEDVASHLNMAIELMQDGYPGDATKKLKQFNKVCKDLLAGKEIGSTFESVNEAKFVKSYDTKVNDAETEKEVLKIYPKAKFFVGKMSHFFGELEPNLFFKAYYPKYYKQDTGKTVKGDFKITSVYSQKGSRYVELMKESVLENFKAFSEFVSENYDTEQRKEMATKGLALSDGSFPIANLEDLKNAIMAYGRAKDQARAAKFIAKRAKALGAEDLIPDTEDFQKSLKG